MAAPKKRKCIFSNVLRKEFPHLRAAEKASTVLCTICHASFSIGSGGRTAIKEHEQTTKHNQAVSAPSNSNPVTSFFRPAATVDKTAEELAVQEGTFAFHALKHNHSFRSMDCTSTLQRKFSNIKFSCSRTKCEAIITKVLAPWAMAEVREDLQKSPFIALLVDASNHGGKKFYPVCARYVKVGPTGHFSVENKLLEFVEIYGETSDILSEVILKISREFTLEEKIIALSADNTNTNFGGLKRSGKRNVFTKLKSDLGREILGIGCNAHMIHNAGHTAMAVIPVDVETLLIKVFSYFHTYTVRIERFKDICTLVGQKHREFLGYGHVRWLSMLPALDRILLLFKPLKDFLLEEQCCPVPLRRILQDPTLELWLLFVQSSMAIFHRAILDIEGQEISAVKSAMIVKTLKTKLRARVDGNFVPTMVQKILLELESNGSINRAQFTEVANSFYEKAISYLNAWSEHTADLQDLSDLMLTRVPERDGVTRAVDYLTQHISSFAIDHDALFDELTFLIDFAKKSMEEWHVSGSSTTKRWSDVFEHFHKNSVPTANLQRIISATLCLPGSNAAVERVFSLMNDYWTTDKSQLSTPALSAVMCVKINLSYTCLEISSELAKRKDILKKIHSSEKYQ